MRVCFTNKWKTSLCIVNSLYISFSEEIWTKMKFNGSQFWSLFTILNIILGLFSIYMQLPANKQAVRNMMVEPFRQHVTALDFPLHNHVVTVYKLVIKFITHPKLRYCYFWEICFSNYLYFLKYFTWNIKLMRQVVILTYMTASCITALTAWPERCPPYNLLPCCNLCPFYRPPQVHFADVFFFLDDLSPWCVWSIRSSFSVGWFPVVQRVADMVHVHLL